VYVLSKDLDMSVKEETENIKIVHIGMWTQGNKMYYDNTANELDNYHRLD